jgi:hypothetical protein
MRARAHLVSGTVRDGIWEASTAVLRYTPAGTYNIEVDAADRAGHSADGFLGTHTVEDATPDLTPPVVRGVSFDKTAVDVRTADGRVTVTARMTDDLSGVDATRAVVCPYAPRGNGGYGPLTCSPLSRIAGSLQDGTWRATIAIPHGSAGGVWNVGIWVGDRVGVGGNALYLGPDAYRVDAELGSVGAREHELAGGRFTVRG